MTFVTNLRSSAVQSPAALQPRMLGASGSSVARPPPALSNEGGTSLPSALLAAAAGCTAACAAVPRRQGGARRGTRVARRQRLAGQEDALDRQAARKITADTDAGALTFEESPREADTGVADLARQAGVKLDVKPWDFLSNIAKDAARGWFVQRAEERGIPWTASVEQMQQSQDELNAIYNKINDASLEYPAYYTLPFHGYDSGNLCWKAAHELEAATFSMCLGYYTGMRWEDAQEMFRGGARKEIAAYWRESHLVSSDDQGGPCSLLDVGCSGGFSTREMMKAFPGAEATGLDLSPFYLAVAQHTYPDMRFVHGRAESTGLPDASFDVVTLNFLLHELPLASSKEVIQEAYRLLAPGGIIAVLDVDPRRLLELPPFRRWAFQVTEPWCKEGEYYDLDLPKALEEVGFHSVKRHANDPVNELVLAAK